MNLIRAFIAFHLSPAVCDYLGQLMQMLAAATPPGAVRWVKADGLHVTLCFLGDSPPARLEALMTELELCAHQRPPFQLSLMQAGCFPDCRRPRVIWAGLADETQSAERLAVDINRRVAALGWQIDKRPFRPHVTLGRVNERFQRPGALTLLLDQPAPALLTPVVAFSLMRSQLRPPGPVYTELRRFELVGG